MTISTTVRKAGPFAGNDVQTVFPFTFKVFTTGDLLVVRATSNVETTLAEGADYSVTLNADQDAAPGGDVTLGAALAAGSVLVITSDIDPLQSVAVTNAGGFFPEVFNGEFDKLTILAQQLAEKASRAFMAPITSSGVSLTVPVLAAGVLQWDATGTTLVAQSLPNLALSLALPSMVGQSGKYLTNDGATANWAAVDFSSFALKATTVTGGGLATGGGDLSANRTVTVPAVGAAEVRAGSDTAKALTTGGVYSGLAVVALTYSGATIVTSGATLDSQAFINGSITLNQNSTLPNFTNPVVGRSGRIQITQDAVTARTLAFGGQWHFPGGVTPNMPTTLGAIAFLDYDIVSATYFRGALTSMG